MKSRATTAAVIVAASADHWATRRSRTRAHLYITPYGLEYRSRP